MINRKKIKGGFYFRHFGESYSPKKPGLYFCYILDTFKDHKRINDKDIVELRDWLSRYINTYHLKTISPLGPEMKAKARSIIKGIEALEASQNKL